ncbi:hypothetical protein Tco_0944783 [Tanacetum coccineum]
MAAPITTATPSPRTTTPKPPSSPSPHHHPAATPPRCHAIPIIIIIIPSPSSCHHHRDIIPPPPPGGMSGIVLTPQGVLFRWTTATMGVSGWLSTAGDSRGCLFRWAFTATRVCRSEWAVSETAGTKNKERFPVYQWQQSGGVLRAPS